MSRSPLAALAAAVLFCGCASASNSPKDEAAPATSPLTGIVGRQLLVLPAQYLSIPNAGGGWDIVPAGSSILPILDEEIADAFRKRGVKSNWTFGEEITRSAARNAGLAGDPRELGAQGVRRIKAGDTPLPEQLASQIRSLISLTNARFALLPLEVRVDVRNGERRGALHLLLVDSRTARIAWVGDIDAPPLRDPKVADEVLSPYGFRLLARELATGLADMVVAQ